MENITIKHTHTTTNIGKDELAILNKLAQREGVKNIQYLNAAIRYLKKTGVNPLEPELSTKEELIKLQKRCDEVLRFIRIFEKDKLMPLLDGLIVIERRLSLSMNDLPKQSEIKKDFVAFHEQLKQLKEDIRVTLANYNDSAKKIASAINGSAWEHHKTQKMISCLFDALKYKGLTAFREIDIKNFNDACNKVRPA